MSENQESFHYTYSAKQQEEIRQIRDKYIPEEKSKIEQLRRLDESVAKPGTAAALLVGTISMLLFGVGMSWSMVWTEHFFVPGIIVGLLGIMGMFTAYPLYAHITKKQREKLAPEIIRLADELLK